MRGATGAIQPATHLPPPALLQPPLTYGGRLLLCSGAPEFVPTYGVLYQDHVLRPFRVYWHHANGTGSPLALYACLKNPGRAPVAVTARAWGAAQGGDPAEVGAQAVYAHLQSPPGRRVVVPPGAWCRWGVARLAPGFACTGVYDFDPEGPLDVAVVAASPGADPDPDALPVLDAGGGERGTFNHGDRHGAVAYATSQGPAAVPLGNHPGGQRASDPWRRPLAGELELGFSNVDGRVVELAGNRGVTYILDLQVHHPGPGPARVALGLQPGSGPFRGAVEVAGRALLCPGTVPGPGWAWWAWQVALQPGETRTVRVRWMAAGGCHLPVRLVLAPAG